MYTTTLKTASYLKRIWFIVSRTYFNFNTIIEWGKTVIYTVKRQRIHSLENLRCRQEDNIAATLHHHHSSANKLQFLPIYKGILPYFQLDPCVVNSTPLSPLSPALISLRSLLLNQQYFSVYHFCQNVNAAILVNTPDAREK